MSGFKSLNDVDVSNKRVMVRVDLNVPMENGRVTDLTRIQRAVPTLKELVQRGAKVIILSHFGRPGGTKVPSMSLKPLVEPLAEVLGKPVAFAEDCVGAIAGQAIDKLAPGDVVLLENLRFHKEEEANDPAFVDALAKRGDIYVNDAFSCAHRAHASTEGIAHRLPAVAGRLMQAELDALNKALGAPERPVAAIVGGAKVSTKLELLGNLVAKVDRLIVGGGMANTFLFAKGMAVGKSLCEPDLAETARDIMRKAEASGCLILLPLDVVAASEFKAKAPHVTVGIDAVPPDTMIVDVGPRTIEVLTRELALCKTVVWNGPLGAFELAPFDAGTTALAQAVAALTAEGKLVSVAGGGDTVAALAHAGVVDRLSYVSTAGGAFLEWMEGKELPGVAALERAA